MSRLVAFGCSNTYGEGLEDCWILSPSGSNMRDGPNPSKFAWPMVLANIMDLECVNLSVPAASNKWICNKMLDTKLSNTDTVVFMWSYFNRTCFFQDDNTYRRLMAQDITNNNKSASDKKYTKRFYKQFSTETDLLIETFMKINFAKLFLDTHGIKNYHFTCDNRLLQMAPPVWNCANVTIPDGSKHNVDVALDNQHPGPMSHSIIASQIHNYIQENQ